MDRIQTDPDHYLPWSMLIPLFMFLDCREIFQGWKHVCENPFFPLSYLFDLGGGTSV